MEEVTKNKGPLPIQKGSLRAWSVAVRPPSLLIAFAPVFVGSALGYRATRHIDIFLAALALLAALLMQVITNLQNDVGYTERGAEAIGQRLGLPRATALGWLSASMVKTAIALLSMAAILLGVAMAFLRGWPVLVLGGTSLLAALAYMGGPRPIAYTMWGEATVLVFFGPVAVLGTGWLLTNSFGMTATCASIAVGCMAAAALAVNNHRDIEHDRLVGRKTFAASFGANLSRKGLAVLLLLPFVALAAMAVQEVALWPLTPIVIGPLTWQLYKDFVRCPGGLEYNSILFRTFWLGLWFATLLSLSAMLAK